MGSPLKRRGRMTDESLEIITRLWTEDTVTFQGDFYQFENIGLEPKPVQKPYPPVLVGGGLASAERAAKYGTYLMPLTPTPAEVRDVIKPRLKELSEQHGNDVKLATMNYTVVSDDEDWIARDVYPLLQRCVGGTENNPTRPEDVAIYGTPQQCASAPRHCWMPESITSSSIFSTTALKARSLARSICAASPTRLFRS